MVLGTLLWIIVIIVVIIVIIALLKFLFQLFLVIPIGIIMGWILLNKGLNAIWVFDRNQME